MRAWLVMFLLMTTAAAAQPTEENLLAAWEAAQRADPKVQVLEASGEREYRFETTHFPYKGRLVVTEAVVDRLPGEYADAVGFIQVRLPDAGEGFLADHSYAHMIWQRSHTFYWSEDEARWLNWDEYQARFSEMEQPFNWWSTIDWFWILFLLIFLVVLVWTTRKANRNVSTSLAAQDVALAQQRKALEMMERGMRANEESNALLREIRDLLKRET